MSKRIRNIQMLEKICCIYVLSYSFLNNVRIKKEGIQNHNLVVHSWNILLLYFSSLNYNKYKIQREIYSAIRFHINLTLKE